MSLGGAGKGQHFADTLLSVFAGAAGLPTGEIGSGA